MSHPSINGVLINYINKLAKKQKHKNQANVIVNTESIIQKLYRCLSLTRIAAVESTYTPLTTLLDRIEKTAIELFENLGPLEIPVISWKRKNFLNNLGQICRLNKWINPTDIHPETMISQCGYMAELVKNFDVEERIDPENFSCASYALLKIGELRGSKFIFSNDQGDLIGQLPKLLRDWGYQSVAEPKEGDLVLYYLNHHGDPNHVGVYRSSGLIDSKFGIINPYIGKHQIFDVPSYYGRKVIFLRKNTTCSL